jgi:hypothetical protein
MATPAHYPKFNLKMAVELTREQQWNEWHFEIIWWCVVLGLPAYFLDSWPLKMRPIGCPETSVRNYHCTVRNSPEGRSSPEAWNHACVNTVWFFGMQLCWTLATVCLSFGTRLWDSTSHYAFSCSDLSCGLCYVVRESRFESGWKSNCLNRRLCGFHNLQRTDSRMARGWSFPEPCCWSLRSSGMWHSRWSSSLGCFEGFKCLHLHGCSAEDKNFFCLQEAKRKKKEGNKITL